MNERRGELWEKGTLVNGRGVKETKKRTFTAGVQLSLKLHTALEDGSSQQMHTAEALKDCTYLCLWYSRSGSLAQHRQ